MAEVFSHPDSTGLGLANGEAARRLELYGRNLTLGRRPPTPMRLFAQRLRSPLIATSSEPKPGRHQYTN